MTVTIPMFWVGFGSATLFWLVVIIGIGVFFGKRKKK